MMILVDVRMFYKRGIYLFDKPSIIFIPRLRQQLGRKSVDFGLTKPLNQLPGRNTVSIMVLHTSSQHLIHLHKMD